MPGIQIPVVDQRTMSGGHETCGYHTFKNALLSLMYAQGLINEIQFKAMLTDRALAQAVLHATQRFHGNGDGDLTLPGFMELLAQAKAGAFNFAKHGITREQLMQLRLTPDGTQGITAANYVLYPGAPGHGLGTMEEDLLVGSATVKLARTKGKFSHVFALGLNNEHWVTAAVQQDKDGVRSWQFMDSYGSQKPEWESRYKDSVVARIEAVLNKSEPELQAYLREVYNNSSDLFMRRYESFFEDTGLPHARKIDMEGNGVLLNAKEYFIGQKAVMEQFAEWIENRFKFMESAGWLDSKEDMEQVWVKQLYHVSKYMVENTDAANPRDLLVKNRLKPIYERLKASLEEKAVEEVAQQPVAIPVVKAVVKPTVTPEAEAAEVAKIRDNYFDIKGHFKLLFDNTLAKKAAPSNVQVVDGLVNEDTLAAQLGKEYPGKDYVVMCYAHKPHSSAQAPRYTEEPRAHTSVLLCKVKNNKIEQVLNVDGYNYTGYVDILGERPGATPNPHIQQRLVIQATGTASGGKTPVQKASWSNMNCVLYSVTFVERILELFKDQPEMMASVFPADHREKVSAESLFLLEEGILAGLVDKYVKHVKGDYVYDETLRDRYHAQLRGALAEQYAAKCAAERLEAQEALKQDTLKQDVLQQDVLKQDVSKQDVSKQNAHKDKEPSKVKEASKDVQEKPAVTQSTGKQAVKTTPDPVLAMQKQAAVDTVNTGTTKATEGFVAKFVRAIKSIINAIGEAFAYVGRKIGLSF